MDIKDRILNPNGMLDRLILMKNQKGKIFD